MDYSPDLEKAREYFLKAAEKNHAKAQFLVGMMYIEGEGGPRDTAEGQKWLGKAATQGIVLENFKLTKEDFADQQ